MQEKTFKQLLMSSNYYTLNKQIVKSLGIETAFLLTILIEASDVLADEDGWFYQTIETLEELTGLSRHRQTKIIQNLIEQKIIHQENRGNPCRRFFKISFQEIENLVFKKTETSLLKIDNNKEYIINNLNKELNNKESYSHNNINIIKELFEKFGINFSDKHRECVNDLLKKNSVEFLVKHFTQQYEILKSNPAVKNVPAVFSKHLFAGTCEVNASEILEREKAIEEKKQNELTEEKQQHDTLEIFNSLPLDKQKEIEDMLLKKAKNPNELIKIKREMPFIYYKMISKQIRNILESEKLIL